MGVFWHDFNEESAVAGMIEVSGRIIEETADAVMLRGAGKDEWLPRSKIKFGPVDIGTGEDVVYMPRWLARKKGYIAPISATSRRPRGRGKRRY